MGKDTQTVSLCPVGCALVVTHIPSVPLVTQSHPFHAILPSRMLRRPRYVGEL